MIRETEVRQTRLPDGPLAKAAARPRPRAGFRHVLACVDRSPQARRVLDEAAALARDHDAALTVLRVIEPRQAAGTPADPVEWDLARRTAEAELSALAQEARAEATATVILGGPPAGRICRLAREIGADLTVLGTGSGTGGGDGWAAAGLGSTVRRVAESAPGSVLIVPPAHGAGAGAGADGRGPVVVPLDSSAQAEAAMPVAMRIARSRGAELLLLHAVPDPGLTVNGPPEAGDRDLCDRLHRRNERVAQAYLDRVRRLAPALDLRTRVRLLADGDPRHALARAAADEGAGMMVLSARGLGAHPDVPIGSTAAYLIAVAKVPVLLLRHDQADARPQARHVPPRPQDSRSLS